MELAELEPATAAFDTHRNVGNHLSHHDSSALELTQRRGEDFLRKSTAWSPSSSGTPSTAYWKGR